MFRNILSKIFLLAIFLILFSCGDEFQTIYESDPTTEVKAINDFVLPDTLKITRELVIAAYYERHPNVGCVIIAYSDSTKKRVKKYNYLNDSSIVINNLISQKYNVFQTEGEFKNEFIIVKPKTVVWEYQLGSVQSTVEYERVDVNN